MPSRYGYMWFKWNLQEETFQTPCHSTDFPNISKLYTYIYIYIFVICLPFMSSFKGWQIWISRFGIFPGFFLPSGFACDSWNPILHQHLHHNWPSMDKHQIRKGRNQQSPNSWRSSRPQNKTSHLEVFALQFVSAAGKKRPVNLSCNRPLRWM